MLKYCWKNHKKIGKLFKKGKDQIDNSLDVLNIVSIIRKINESDKRLKDNESQSNILDLDSSDVNQDIKVDVPI